MPEQFVALLQAIGADNECRQIVDLRLLPKALEKRLIALRILMQLALVADRGFRLMTQKPTPRKDAGNKRSRQFIGTSQRQRAIADARIERQPRLIGLRLIGAQPGRRVFEAHGQAAFELRAVIGGGLLDQGAGVVWNRAASAT